MSSKERARGHKTMAENKIERPTTEFTLQCGWKVWIVDYFTQGEFDAIQNIMLEKVKIEDASIAVQKEISDIKYTFSGKVVSEMADKTKELAVVKIQLPDGKVFEGEALTLEIIKSVPYDEKTGDEIKVLVDKHISKKKATSKQ